MRETYTDTHINNNTKIKINIFTEAVSINTLNKIVHPKALGFLLGPKAPSQQQT